MIRKTKPPSGPDAAGIAPVASGRTGLRMMP